MDGNGKQSYTANPYKQINHTCRFLFVTSEDLDFLLEVPDVKELAQVVAGCRQKPVSIEVPLDLHDSVLMCMTSHIRDDTL